MVSQDYFGLLKNLLKFLIILCIHSGLYGDNGILPAKLVLEQG